MPTFVYLPPQLSAHATAEHDRPAATDNVRAVFALVFIATLLLVLVLVPERVVGTRPRQRAIPRFHTCGVALLLRDPAPLDTLRHHDLRIGYGFDVRGGAKVCRAVGAVVVG
jgi:hypothetical protein